MTTEMSVAPPGGEDRIMIYGPKSVLIVGDRFDHGFEVMGPAGGNGCLIFVGTAAQ